MLGKGDGLLPLLALVSTQHMPRTVSGCLHLNIVIFHLSADLWTWAEMKAACGPHLLHPCACGDAMQSRVSWVGLSNDLGIDLVVLLGDHAEDLFRDAMEGEADTRKGCEPGITPCRP